LASQESDQKNTKFIYCSKEKDLFNYHERRKYKWLEDLEVVAALEAVG